MSEKNPHRDGVAAEAKAEELKQPFDIANSAGSEARVEKDNPRLLVDETNPDRTVAALRSILRQTGGLYDRGIPVRLVIDNMQHGVVAHALTPELLVVLTHQICRPY
jgi:hypothetical protein